MAEPDRSTVHDAELGRALDEARTLLEFAVRHRVAPHDPIEPKALLASIDAVEQALVAKQAPKLDELVAFWKEYDKLATLLDPVTARSITATRAFRDAGWGDSWRGPAPWLAFAAAALFALAAFLQDYWATGADLLAQIEKVEAPTTAALDALTQPRVDVAIAQSKYNEALSRLDALKKEAATAAAAASAAASISTTGRTVTKPVKAVGAEEQQRRALEEARRTEAIRTAETEARGLKIAGIDAEARFSSAEIGSTAQYQVVDSAVRALDQWCRWFCDRAFLDQQKAAREKIASELELVRKAREDAQLKYRVAEKTRNCERADSAPSPHECALKAETDALQTPLKNLQARLREVDLRQLRSTIHHARSVCNSIGGYFIPLLMGMLGALVFLMRDIVRAVAAFTYSSRSIATAVIYVSLGAGAGLLGRLLLPASGDATLVSFSPFALAFVFGFGLNVLFSMLDKIVGTFSSSTPNPTTTVK